MGQPQQMHGAILLSILLEVIENRPNGCWVVVRNARGQNEDRCIFCEEHAPEHKDKCAYEEAQKWNSTPWMEYN